MAIAKGASYYDPRRHGERALQRRNLVISLLGQQGLINNDVADRASARGLGISRQPGTRTNPFPGYLDLVKRQLRQDYDEEAIRAGGLRVFTHFNPQIQRKLEAVISTRMPALEQRKGVSGQPVEVASLVGATRVLQALIEPWMRDDRLAQPSSLRSI